MVFFCKYVSERAAVAADARRASGLLAIDSAIGADHACEIQLGDRLDDAGAADPGHAASRLLLFEIGIVRPQFAADDAEAGFKCLGADAHALDGARGGSLTGADLGTFEGRPGRTGGSQQPVTITEQYLGVGAHIDDEGDFVPVVRCFREKHAGGVCADVPRYAGQRVGVSTGRDGDADVASRHRERGVAGERERRRPQLHGAQAERQVHHDGIAGERDLHDVARLDAGLPRHVRDQAVDCLADSGGQLGIAARIHLYIGDAAHEILAEADLRVHAARAAENLTAREMAQVRGDGRGADVDGDAVQAIAEPGPDGDVRRAGHAPGPHWRSAPGRHGSTGHIPDRGP